MKFETGFSKSHVSEEEMIALLYSDVGELRRRIRKEKLGAGARFRFKLEVHEL